MVTDKYLRMHHHPDVSAFADWADIVGLAVLLAAVGASGLLPRPAS